MALYYGDTIGGASNQEQQALDRAIQLGLANRSFLAQQQSQGNELANENANRAQQAAMAAWQEQHKSEDEAYNRAVALEATKYGRSERAYELGLGLSEAEKNRANLKDIYGARTAQADLNQARADEIAMHNEFAKRIANGDITNPEQLDVAATAAKLSPQRRLDLSNLLSETNRKNGIRQQIGPDLSANLANDLLSNDPYYVSAAQNPNPVDANNQRVMAINSTFKKMESLPDHRGHVIPDYKSGKFLPKPTLYSVGASPAQDPTKDPNVIAILGDSTLSRDEKYQALKELGVPE